MSNICIIPARGNSKRIKNKNIRKFNDMPMISFAIKAAIASNLFEHIMVSTDNDEIAKIAKKFNAEVPFKRPDHLSDDFTDTQSVINHSICECEKLGWDFNFVCCIYPCVPFLNKDDILKSHDILRNSTKRFVLPIAETNSNPKRSLGIRNNGEIFSLFPDFERFRTQDLTETFFDVGQFYWGHKNSWKTSKSIHNNSKGLKIPKWRAIDIDNEEDWFMAELLYSVLEKRGQIEII